MLLYSLKGHWPGKWSSLNAPGSYHLEFKHMGVTWARLQQKIELQSNKHCRLHTPQWMSQFLPCDLQVGRAWLSCHVGKYNTLECGPAGCDVADLAASTCRLAV